MSSVSPSSSASQGVVGEVVPLAGFVDLVGVLKTLEGKPGVDHMAVVSKVLAAYHAYLRKAQPDSAEGSQLSVVSDASVQMAGSCVRGTRVGFGKVVKVPEALKARVGGMKGGVRSLSEPRAVRGEIPGLVREYNSSMPGYCYLSIIRPAVRAKVALGVGPNPSLKVLASLSMADCLPLSELRDYGFDRVASGQLHLARGGVLPLSSVMATVAVSYRTVLGTLGVQWGAEVLCDVEHEDTVGASESSGRSGWVDFGLSGALADLKLLLGHAVDVRVDWKRDSTLCIGSGKVLILTMCESDLPEMALLYEREISAGSVQVAVVGTVDADSFDKVYLVPGGWSSTDEERDRYFDPHWLSKLANQAVRVTMTGLEESSACEVVDRYVSGKSWLAAKTNTALLPVLPGKQRAVVESLARFWPVVTPEGVFLARPERYESIVDSLPRQWFPRGVAEVVFGDMTRIGLPSIGRAVGSRDTYAYLLSVCVPAGCFPVVTNSVYDSVYVLVGVISGSLDSRWAVVVGGRDWSIVDLLGRVEVAEAEVKRVKRMMVQI